jgi:SP family arabinose:H+ symporter-like MFS transporter
MGYLAFFALSLGPIVWVLIGEIFPNRVRSRGVAISIFLMWVANFAISYSLPILLKFIGGGFTFLIYALMCIPCFLFVWKYLIETKGKTLEQIEHDYLH